MWKLRFFFLAYACTIIIWTVSGIQGDWLYGEDIVEQTFQGLLEGTVIGLFPAGLAGIFGVIYDRENA